MFFGIGAVCGRGTEARVVLLAVLRKCRGQFPKFRRFSDKLLHECLYRACSS
jgi:hypothetical protein